MSRELDAKIAELRGEDRAYLKSYSTSIRFAMELWDEMWSSGEFRWLALTRSENGCCVEYEKKTEQFQWLKYPMAKDEKLAICNAWLAWKEAQCPKQP